METPQQSTTKSRTTIFLTPENRTKLDLIPKGKRTEIINKALAIFLSEMEREEKRKKLISMINDIKPVKSKYDSVELTRAIREHRLNEFTNGQYD